MPMENKQQMHSELVDEQMMFCIQALQDKRKHIDNAKKYAWQQDTSCWEVFFSDQQEIINRSFIGN